MAEFSGDRDVKRRGLVENYPSPRELVRVAGVRRNVRRTVVLGALATASFAPKWAAAEPSTTTVEQGYELGEIQHPHAVAVGGAQNALGTSTTAIFHNPANLPLARVYHFEGLAAVGLEARRQSYGGAVADSATNRLAGGFGGTWSQLDPDGLKRTWTDLRLALAYPFGDRLSFGIAGRYLRTAQGVARGPLGASLASDGTSSDPIYNGFTFDAGATILPTSNLRIGLVGHNLTNPSIGLAPTTFGGGIGYQSSLFAIEADGMADFTTYRKTKSRIMAGGTLFLADRFPVRGGYRYDDGMKTHAVSAGVGYVDKQFSVDLAGRRDVVADFPATTIVLGFRFFYQSASTPDESESSF